MLRPCGAYSILSGSEWDPSGWALRLHWTQAPTETPGQRGPFDGSKSSRNNHSISNHDNHWKNSKLCNVLANAMLGACHNPSTTVRHLSRSTARDSEAEWTLLASFLPAKTPFQGTLFWVGRPLPTSSLLKHFSPIPLGMRRSNEHPWSYVPC